MAKTKKTDTTPKEPVDEGPATPPAAPATDEAAPAKTLKKATRAKAKAAPTLSPNQVSLYSVEGEVKGVVDLPNAFLAPVRSDLIRRAVTASRANRRQPYGPSPTAGTRHSVRWSGKGHGVSRVPRIRGTMIGAQMPGTRGGRRAHPPRPRTIWAKKINGRERRTARLAAVAATHDVALVAARGHRFRDSLTLPVVVEDGIEKLEKTAAGIAALRSVGVFEDVERAQQGSGIRAGRGKMRGRRYRVPRSLLVVVSDVASGRKVFGNLPGVDVAEPRGLNAELLAPGGDPGRLVVFSQSAIEQLRGWS